MGSQRYRVWADAKGCYMVAQDQNRGEKQNKRQDGELSIPQISILSKDQTRQDNVEELGDIMNNGMIAEEKGKGAVHLGQDMENRLETETEQDWTCVKKGGRHSLRKQIEGTSRKQQDASKITKEKETISPSRFTVLSKSNEDEEGQEKGEITVEVTSKDGENHSSSSEEEDEPL